MPSSRVDGVRVASTASWREYRVDGVAATALRRNVTTTPDAIDATRDHLRSAAQTTHKKNNAGAGGKRARGAARGGGQEYWRKLYRDVDYGDQHDVARFHEIYGNVTREEATFNDNAKLNAMPMPMQIPFPRFSH